MKKYSAQASKSGAPNATNTAPNNARAILTLIFSFLLTGIFLIADATVIYATNLYGDPYRFAFLQLVWILIGLVGFSFFYRVDYKTLSKLSYILLLLNFIFLGILAFAGIFRCRVDFNFAPCLNGAHRWLYFNPPPLPKLPFIGVLGFQPSEFAKLSLILYLATQISKLVKNGEKPFKVFLVISGLVSGLIMMQPNMSTAVMLFAIGTAIYFASNAPIRNIIYLAVPIILLVVCFVMFSPYRRERFMTLVRHNSSQATQGVQKSQDETSDYHMNQVLISLGSGGFWGVGFGQSKQKYQYLPEIASDSIFAIVGEEFGFVGTTVIIGMFSYFIYKGLQIAKNSPDLLGRLLAVGVTSWIGLQFFVNVAAMAKIIPLTGVPIPLISYGGSSMLFTMMGLGLLANVAKNS